MANVFSNSDFYNENFFVIDSNNLMDVKSRLYGFVLINNSLYIGSNNRDKSNDVFFKIPDSIPYDSYGCFVRVIKNDSMITISQDYFGSYGLYLFKNDSGFCISNSFLYLVEYLSKKIKLNFDNDGALSFLASPQASLVYQDTLVSEIKMLPRNSIVNIDVIKCTISIDYFEQKESYIDINTEEAINLLDSWHLKWSSLISSLISNNDFKVRFDLSGGKDSRASFACCKSKNIDLSNLHFYTAQDDLYSHKDDYEIATKISEIYKFVLNDDLILDRFRVDPLENLNMSLLTKCGFHKELMPSVFWNNKPFIRITGSGGDLRDLWNESLDSFINKIVKETVYNTIDSRSAIKRLLLKSISEIDSNPGFFYKERDRIATDYFYKQGRMRNHNGKANVELFLSNTIILSPIMDPVLYKINQKIGLDNDNDLLYYLIYSRYISEISNLEFDSDRTIKEKTKEVALSINKEYPFNVDSANADSFNVYYSSRVSPSKATTNLTPLDCLKELFYSKKIEEFVNDVFGNELYRRAKRYYSLKSYHPYISASGLIQCYIIYNLCQKSQYDGDHPTSYLYYNTKTYRKPQLYYNSGFFKEILEFLQSARVDVKNIGSPSPDVFIVNTDDEHLFVEKPRWFKDESSSGIVVQSTAGHMSITFNICSTGRVIFKFMGPWMKTTTNNEIIDVKVDLVKIVIKDLKMNKVLYSNNNLTTVSSVNPHFISFDCYENQQFNVSIDWLPYCYNSEELSILLPQLFDKDLSDYKFWKKH